MAKFEVLTKYIPIIQESEFGEWVVDTKNDGSIENPKHFPYVKYQEQVGEFQNDLYMFCENEPQYDYTNYRDTLAENGIEWESQSMRNADVSNLDEKCIIALLVGAVRAERFCGGALLGFFEHGDILRWLNRLKELEG